MAARLLKDADPAADEIPAAFTTPETIVLVAAADDQFVMPLATMVRSVLGNIRVPVDALLYIIDGGITPEDRAHLLASWQRETLCVRWLQPNWSHLSNLKVTGHVNLLTYARLLIPALVPPCHAKALYLDSDIIVLGDLGELWDIDPGARHLLAAQDMTAPYMCSELRPCTFAACGPYLSAARRADKLS